MTLLRKIGLCAYLVFTMVCENSCHNNKDMFSWKKVLIDPKISENNIYLQLNKQPEIFSFGEKTDSLRKRTSDVAYFIGEKINLTDSNYSKFNNCRANLLHDTLNINVGIGSGFTGQGFVIRFYGKKFYTNPYSWKDVIDLKEQEPTYKIIYQRLTLDKPRYIIGDSLYGKIDFKAIETNNNQNPVQHLAKGYFRTNIEKPFLLY